MLFIILTKIQRNPLFVIGLGRYKPVFTTAQEKELVEHILAMECRLFGLSLNELRQLAFELAERNNLLHTFNRRKSMAGKAWLYSFLKRHPELRLRSPESTSIARAIGFNRPAVQQFFSLLSDVYCKHNLSPSQIYNVDETGIMTVPKKRSKCLALRGKRQVGCLTSAERGILVTAETCMNAAGNFMPTMFVFPRERAKPELLDDAPPGSTAAYHPSGWMQKNIFLMWFKMFIDFSKPTKDKAVLLLLDGHSTHTKSLELLELARAHNIILLCFPPHTTHRLQPLDVSFMAPLSSYYSQEVQKWLQMHPGRAVTISQIGKLYGSAFMKAACVQTAVNGFRKTGIYPYNPDVFPDWMFDPAETTNKPLQIGTADQIPGPGAELPNTIVPQPPTTSQSTDQRESNPSLETGIMPLDQPISSTSINVAVDAAPGILPAPESVSSRPTSCGSLMDCRPTSNFKIRSPKDISKIPQAERKNNVGRNDKRKGKTAILTSSPYKQELVEAMEAKKGKAAKKMKLDFAKVTNSTSTKTKDLHVKKNKKKFKPVKTQTTESSSEEDNEDEACIYCNDLFSNSKSSEGWIKCLQCQGWAHEACCGIEPEDCEAFICDYCSLPK